MAAVSAGAPVVQAAADTEAFTQVAQVQAQTITVPTVIEIPLETFIERSTFAVYQVQTNSFVPYAYEVEEVVIPTVLSATANTAGSAQVLIDGDYDTTLHFPLGETIPATAEIVLRAQNSITASSFVFSLAKNVARPTHVAVYATDAQGEESIVVAKTRLQGSVVSFPQTTAGVWRIEFTHAQPLRVAEVRLVEDEVEKSTTRTLRFLAQPQYEYAIYLNPDRSVRIPTAEAGNLSRNEDVVSVTAPTVLENPLYRIADNDADGVPDWNDNCVSTPNPLQEDVNENGRGDVCDDFDRDGIVNNADNCPNEPNRRQADEDGDGIGDMCDDEESRLTEKYAWIPWVGLALAALIIATMFAVVLRRPEEEVESDEVEVPPQTPQV